MANDFEEGIAEARSSADLNLRNQRSTSPMICVVMLTQKNVLLCDLVVSGRVTMNPLIK